MTSESGHLADHPNRAQSLFRRRAMIVIFLFATGLSYCVSQASNSHVSNLAKPVQPNELNAASVPPSQQTKNRGRRVKASVSAMPSKWYIWTSPDGDFRLEFPGKPMQEVTGQGPITLIRMFGSITNDGMHFSINFQDIGGDPKAPENNEWGKELEEMASAADRKDGLQIVQTHRRAKNIVETEIWQPMHETKTNINYLRRSIINRGRVYTLTCGSILDGRTVNRPVCQRFFSSMRFTTRPRQH